MSERDDLLVSVASEIKTYRKGELPEPTLEHVDRWECQNFCVRGGRVIFRDC